MEKALLFLEENKRKLLVGAVAYVLYVFAQSNPNEISGMIFHVILNAFVFLFASQAVVTFAEKAVADRRKETV